MQTAGIHAGIVILIYLITVGMSFKALSAIKIENLIKPNHVFEAQLFILFSSLALGYLVGNLLIAVMDQSLSLRLLFF